MPYGEKTGKKYERLLDDPDFRRWHSNVAKGSVILGDGYVKAMGRFCEWARLTPKEFAHLPVDKMENKAQDYVDFLETTNSPSTKKPYSPGTVDNYLTAIRSWSSWNRKNFQRNIKIRDASKTPTLVNERIPTIEELNRVLYSDRTPLRTRVSIALIAFSGCRFEVQGNYLGTDGLRISDLPELKIVDREVSFDKVPTQIIVREELSKSRRQYVSFLATEGCELLKQYLERRLLDGEKLLSSSPIIVTNSEGARRAGRFGVKDITPMLRTPKISEGVRESMRRAGLPWRPYVFRSYFDTILSIAESKAFLSHSFQQFWMGHTGDIEAVYTTRKYHLPPDLIEEMRTAYKRCEQLLASAGKAPKTVEEGRIAFRKGILADLGVSEAEIEKMNLSEMTSEQFQKAAREKVSGFNGRHQEFVQPKEVDEWANKGYLFSGNLPDGRVVMSAPESFSGNPFKF